MSDNNFISSFVSTITSFVITGITKTLVTTEQMITSLASFGALDYIRSHKRVIEPLLTLDEAKYFQPTPELFRKILNVLFSEEGCNKKAWEIDMYKNGCDHGQDLRATEGSTNSSKGSLLHSYSFKSVSDCSNGTIRIEDTLCKGC